MDTFGERLRLERERCGLSVQEVAEIVGADPTPLLALERNDFDALPDESTMTRYLEAYAECLRVDAGLMIADYEREKCLRELAAALPEQVSAGTSAVAPSAVPRPRSGLKLAAFAVVATIGIVGGWWLLSADGVTPGAPVVDSPASTKTASGRAAGTTEPRGPSSTRPRAHSGSTATTSPGPTASTTMSPSGLSVADCGVGTSVASHELVGRGERFTEGSQVWFWTRVEGGEAGDTIDHVWLRDGEEAARIPLRIGGSRWRTYSAKVLRSTGRWAVEARDAAGRLLARREFSCVP